MNSLFVSIALFILTVIFHNVFHRLLLKYHIITFKSVGIFLIVFFVLVVSALLEFKGIFHIRINLTIITLYLILSLDYIVVISSPFLGDEGPSSKIVFLLKKHKSLSKDNIINKFSNERLIKKRLNDLTRSKLIEKRNNKYFIISGGKRLVSLIKIYRKTIGWKLVG
jgi:hypothetical protein